MDMTKVMLPPELRNELQKFLIYDQIQLTLKSLHNGVLCNFHLQLFDHVDDINNCYVSRLDDLLQLIATNPNYIDTNYSETLDDWKNNEWRCDHHKFIYSNKKITYIKFNYSYSKYYARYLLSKKYPIKYKHVLDEIQTEILIIRLKQLHATIKQQLASLPKSILKIVNPKPASGVL